MEEDKREGGRLVRHRLRVLLVVLAAVLCAFGYLLYDLQYVHGAEYLASSQYKNVQTETVDAARGEILDSLGRVLVSNQVSYQAALNLSKMGNSEERNATLLELLDLCRANGLAWNDTLAVTAQAPFSYTSSSPFYTTGTDEDGKETRTLTYLGRLAVKLKWIDGDPTEVNVALPSAPELMETICVWFGLIEEGETVDETARAAAGVLYELTLRAQDINRNAYVFAENVGIELIATVKNRALAGVEFNTTTTRQYNTAYAAQILGQVGSITAETWPYYKELGYSMNATVGTAGVESAFEEYLHGASGTRQMETNSNGKVVSETWSVDPEPGGNVVLTLDIQLQEMVEQALAAHVSTLPEAKGAAAVILDVNSAAVLATASYPTFAPADFYTNYQELAQNTLSPMLNRVTMGLFPPGSTFKMVTAIGGLEEGIITPTDTILDTGRYMYYAPSYTPQCWIYRQSGGTHGRENVTDAIKDSCNVFFYDVGRRLGITKLNEYARMFGLGEPTGIELGESIGVVAGPEYTEEVLHTTWYEGSTLSAAIGQENNQFTPLQLANYIATLVNGGNHYSVHLLKEVKSADFSEVIYTREPELLNKIDIDPANLEAVKQGMLAVTTGNGSAAAYFKDLGFQVGAKTGSAQVSAESESNAVFVAFAPYDEPEIALCIVVEKGGSGSGLAELAADIMAYYFNSDAALGTGQGENALIR